MNLFIDTTNNNLLLIIEKENQILSKKQILNENRISDIVFENLTKLFTDINAKITDVKNIYFLNGPGSYTGVKVAVSICKTLRVLNEELNFYVMNSLQFQSTKKNSISLIDAKSSKWYCSIIKDSVEIEKPHLIQDTEVKNLVEEKYKGFEVVKNFEKINYQKQFLQWRDSFKEISDLKEFEPVYVKDFI